MKATYFLAALLVGCAPQGPAGHLTLKLTGVAASTLSFDLENRTSRAISVVASPSFLSGAVPQGGGLTCSVPSGGLLQGSAWALDSGVHFTLFTVTPESTLQLQVLRPNDIRLEGGLCHLDIELLDGRRIASPEFSYPSYGIARPKRN